ncbi:MAG: hypothetical protein EB127_05485 [Alphaproteobacteria bacterium]|nr:hypothetical protein [Alphaproteobacteria bacterium]
MVIGCSLGDQFLHLWEIKIFAYNIMSRQVKEISFKSYVAATPFHNDFFTYTVTMNPSTFKKTGALAAVSGATATTCPAGRILRENGRKLFPGAHDGVRTLMVGVFDNQSMLSGFIDPNSPDFAVYNTDRPNYLVDAVDPAGGLTDQGPPVKTNGQVATRVVPLGTLAVAGTTTLDTSLGRIFTVTLNSSGTHTVNVGSNLVAGIYVDLIITGGAGTLTFGTGFKKSQTGIVTANVLTLASGTITMCFISDGTNLFEISRTAALT